MSYPSNVANDQLRAFVERVERLEDEIKDLNRDKSEVYAEAKGNGFDVPTIKKVVRIRKLDDAERMEADALLSLYLSALGMAEPEDDSTSHVHVHAHVEIIEEIPPHDADGVILETDDEFGAVPAVTHGNNRSAERPHGPDRSTAARKDVQERPIAKHGLTGASVNGDSPRGEGETTAPAGTQAPPVEANPNSAPAPQEQSVADSDRGGGSPPPSTASVVSIRTHNPEVHFLSEKGLLRLHGCLKPELCGSTQPRTKLCFDCSRLHDGPAHQGDAA